MFQHPIGAFAQGFNRLPYGFGKVRHLAAGLFYFALHLVEQGKGRIATVHQFACHQIHCLDAVRALVNRGDADIAQILCGTCFFDKAHATVHLHSHRCNIDARICSKRLGDWG